MQKSRSTKAMPVPKTAAKPKAAAKAKNAKTKAVTMLAKRRQVHECDESDESAQGDESDESAAPPKRRRSTKAMPVPKTPAKPKAKAKAKNDAKTKDGTIKVPFMGTGTTMMPDYARKAPDPPVDMAGGALPQVVLQQSWHIDTRDVPEIWIDASFLSQRAALPGDKILFKVFKLD